ncbi:MAG: glycosyltransferase family 4 protein [Verrucomicrobiota bacterium]
MKVLFLAPQPFFRVRGTPINVRNIVTALGEAGHRVDLLCYPWGEDLAMAGVRLFRVLRVPGLREVRPGPSMTKIPLDFFMFWQALWMCLRNRYDVIHAVEESAFFAVWLKKIFRCRLIYDMDSSISEQLRYTGFTAFRPLLRLAELLERSAMRHADFVLTVCESLSDDVRRRSPSARVVQIEDAPLQPAFQEDGEGAARLRGELGLGNAPAVVYTGNFESYQGVDLLLRAISILRRQRVDVRCVLVGGEPDQVARMKDAARSLDLAEPCIFVGKRPMEEMPAFMTLSSLLVSPRTQGTNTALKIYTYMQSGKPIVATRLATHTQVLDDACAVLVVPQADDLAAGMLRVLKDPALGAALGKEAQARVAARYSLASFKHKVRTAYQELADGQPAPPRLS